MGSTALAINEHVRKRENYHTLLRMQAMFTPDTENLLAPHRVLILSTYSNRIKALASRKLQFLLCNDVLIAAQNSSGLSPVLSLVSINLLSDMEVWDIPDILSCFGVVNVIQVATSTMCFLIQFPNEVVKAEWLDVFKTTFAELATLNETPDVEFSTMINPARSILKMVSASIIIVTSLMLMSLLCILESRCVVIHIFWRVCACAPVDLW
jgi:hypothetical protein